MLSMSHMLLEPYVPMARVLVDMTCGNGHDTAFLAERMARDASLYAFDIQDSAIAATRQRLRDKQLFSDRVHLLQGSHDQLLEQVPDIVDLIVFNLGYLPSGDHALHTTGEITVKAIKIGLHKIAKNGIIMLAAYPGTDAGAAEAHAVRTYLQTVPQKDYDVSMWQPLNQYIVRRNYILYRKEGNYEEIPLYEDKRNCAIPSD